jgi:hypothetical protein
MPIRTIDVFPLILIVYGFARFSRFARFSPLSPNSWRISWRFEIAAPKVEKLGSSYLIRARSMRQDGEQPAKTTRTAKRLAVERE